MNSSSSPARYPKRPSLRTALLAFGAAFFLLCSWWADVAIAQESPPPFLRTEFHLDPDFAQVWRRDGEGNYDYIGRSGQKVTLDLDRLEAANNREIVVDFQVQLWRTTWTSPAEYLSVAGLREAGRFPPLGTLRLPMSAGERFQAWTKANPWWSLGGCGFALTVIGALWFARRRGSFFKLASDGASSVELLDGYILGEKLGAGAMGEVFAARDAQGGEVALKFLRKELTEKVAAERFDREIAASVKLSHPHLLPVYGYGFTTDGRLYLVTDLLRGKTLKDHLKSMVERPPELALEVLEQVGSALTYLHGKGFVHRDVKPENIFLRENGDLVLMDLGIMHKAKDESLTAVGQALGTPAYMAPEHIRGKPRAASDQYALGLVLYEILAGARPFPATDITALVHQQIHEPPPPLRNREPQVSLELEAAVLKMLKKNADNRYTTVEEAREAVSEPLLGVHWRRSVLE